MGRRREFDSSDENEQSKELPDTKQKPAANPQNDPNAFSIGHSATDVGAFMDFFLNEKDDETEVQPDEPPKRDELMDALNAIDDDIVSPPPAKNNTEGYQSEEEIVFDDTPTSETKVLTTEQEPKPKEDITETVKTDDLEEPDQDDDIDLDLEMDVFFVICWICVGIC